MLCRRGTAHNVAHQPSFFSERVGDQRPVASPRHSFGAHDRSAFFAGDLHQCFQPLREFLARHVVGESSEGSIAPTEIQGIFHRAAQSAELLEMPVTYERISKRFLQFIFIELRIVSRLRDRPNIGDRSHIVRLQYPDKFINRMRRMTDGENYGLLHYSCAGICESLSRHALSFKRRHTQHNPSVDAAEHSPPHTTHGAGLRGRSESSEARLACCRISSDTTVSCAAICGCGSFLRFTTPL